MEVEQLIVFQLWLGFDESIVTQQRDRKGKTERLISFEFIPVNTIKAGEVTLVTIIIASSTFVSLFLVTFFTVVNIVVRELVEFLMLFDAVFTVVNTVLTIHRAGGVVKKFITAVGDAVRRRAIADIVRRVSIVDAAVQSARLSERRAIFSTAASKFMRVCRKSRWTSG